MNLRAIIATTLGAAVVASGTTARTFTTPAQANTTSIIVPTSGLKWRNMGPFRAPPVQNESVPLGIVPRPPCPSCGRGGNDGKGFRRALERGASGQSQYDGLAYLIGTLYPNACWGA